MCDGECDVTLTLLGNTSFVETFQTGISKRHHICTAGTVAVTGQIPSCDSANVKRNSRYCYQGHLESADLLANAQVTVSLQSFRLHAPSLILMDH